MTRPESETMTESQPSTLSLPPTFQRVLSALQEYWAEQGCLIWQPSNIEVGAGTMNPATFLYVLGPEPWNVAYLEPSLRPDDGRYGENPNRLGKHHQFQVILKPDPGDPQQLYLDSLKAIGIDLRAHDVRFVEDNWESPALGAWGLGWEVWLDGLEITQFTYFQQAGSMDLDPNSVEITYGLDRILMALQDVTHFKDLRWNDRVTYGELQTDYEVETSRYYFEHADVDRLTQLYDLYEAEAKMAAEVGLTRVAHDYVLKSSHVFNVLDARGTIGVTERARYFARMRTLARAVAQNWVETRSEAGFPLSDDPGERAWIAGLNAGADAGGTAASNAMENPLPPESPADFVLEVGTEELPPSEAEAAISALSERMSDLLSEVRLSHGTVECHATPRRLVARVHDLAARQADIEEHVVGPPKRAAFDSDGAPTRAAEGFAKSIGAAVSDLEIVERGGEERVAAVKREAGRLASEVLAETLPGLIDGIGSGRTMRWNASRQAFSRPIRWIVVLHGEHVIPLHFAGLSAGRATRGLRAMGSPVKALAAASDHAKLMKVLGVELDAERRRQQIGQQVDALATEVGGHAPDDPDLLEEVSQLVEQPFAIRGDFDPAYLELPDAILVTVMRKHQRYFPVYSGSDQSDSDSESPRLLPYFITVSNGASVDADVVRHGNEGVIRARFADAAYFWKQDKATSLSDFTPKLEGLTFQADLGSMLDKVGRLKALTPALADRLGLDASMTSTVERAAALCKSDLATSMVVDFTSLQGVMGREYALLAGEPPAVADAIAEHYKPSSAGGALPGSAPGTVLALADRLDSLVGLFSAGIRPSGANDPYALRRSAQGIVRILAEGEQSLDLGAAIDDTAAHLPGDLTPEARADVLDFLRTRLEVQLRDAGQPADVVSAVLVVQGQDPARAVQSVSALADRTAADDWERTLTAYARCARIVRGREDVPVTVDADRLSEPAELELNTAVDQATANLNGDDISAVIDTLAELAPAIDRFFEDVLVMADDPGVRAARLALVGRVARLPERVADLSAMEGF